MYVKLIFIFVSWHTLQIILGGYHTLSTCHIIGYFSISEVCHCLLQKSKNTVV